MAKQPLGQPNHASKSAASIWSIIGSALAWSASVLALPLVILAAPAFLYGRYVARPVLVFSLRLGCKISGALAAFVGDSVENAKGDLEHHAPVALYVIGISSLLPPVIVLAALFEAVPEQSLPSGPFAELLGILIIFTVFAAIIIGVVGMDENQHREFDIPANTDCEDAHRAILSKLYNRSALRHAPLEYRYLGVASLLREQGFRFVRRTQMQEDVWITQNAERMVRVPIQTSGVFTLASALAFCVLASTLTFIAVACAFFLSGGYWQSGGVTLLIGVALGIGFSVCRKYAEECGKWLSQFRIRIERIASKARK